MSAARLEQGGAMEVSEHAMNEYVIAGIGEQLFGLPIARVQDVFAPGRVTRVPLAASEIAGVLNLRGRIVTLIDLRQRLGMAPAEGVPVMAIGVESRGESYGLLIDSVGEVLKLSEEACQPNPLNLERRLAQVSTGIYRLKDQLLIILDVDRVLDIEAGAIAA